MTEINDELDFELDVQGGADRDHRRATVIGQVSVRGTKHAINIDEAGNRQQLPIKNSQMQEGFKAALRQAYIDYGQPEIYVFQGRIQYSNKFAFTDR
jgi:hypothetical protein